MDDAPGRGAFLGDMHAAILQALGCVGYVTNGAVRELPAVRSMGIQLFAGSVAVSHAYAHIFEIGSSISVGGMRLRPGEILHGDRHGVLTVPGNIAAKIPEAAAKLRATEQKVIDVCRSADFSVPKLREVMKSGRKFNDANLRGVRTNGKPRIKNCVAVCAYGDRRGDGDWLVVVLRQR
jgi:regulator of RNase E activity RraA